MSAIGADAAQQAMWRRAAEGWERHQQTLRERTAPVTQWLVDAISPQPGDRVLELAAGPGETGLVAADRIGPGGRLLSTDQSPEMVEIARRRAAERGLDNVDFAVVDAQELDLPPGSFDAVLCRWGYMLMGDPDEAMRRTRRALRDGGRLALATWDRPDRNLWLVAPMMALVGQGVIPPPDPTAPSPVSMHDPDAIERRLLEAGFRSARTDTVSMVQEYRNLDDYWTETLDLAAPIAALFDGLDDATVTATRTAVAEILARFRRDDGSYAVPASAVVAVAEA